MKQLILPICTAAILWTVMFSPWTSSYLNFWYSMTASALLLTLFVFLFSRPTFSLLRFTSTNILLGIGIAALLWGIFYVGNLVATWIFPFAPQQIDSIYGMKTGQSPSLLSILLLLIIGPAEELFWRGYIQKNLSVRLSPICAFITTTLIYTAVHWASFNFMLLMAAFTCGLLWGLLCLIMPHRLAAILLSHAIWDAAVFVWFPIT